MHSKHTASVQPEAVTRFDYLCTIHSGFHILSDQAFVIGTSIKDKKTIIKEHISDRSAPIVTYSANSNQVLSFIVKESENYLLAGNYNRDEGSVVQFDLSTGQIVKNYGRIGIEGVLSSVKFGNLSFFGGYSSSKLIVIDSMRKRVVHAPVETAVLHIRSMNVFVTKNNLKEKKVFLFIAGLGVKYSNRKTDVFDISELVDKFGIWCE